MDNALNGLQKAQLRKALIDAAIASGSGLEYNADGQAITNPDKIVEAAKKFEKFMNEETTNG